MSLRSLTLKTAPASPARSRSRSPARSAASRDSAAGASAAGGNSNARSPSRSRSPARSSASASAKVSPASRSRSRSRSPARSQAAASPGRPRAAAAKPDALPAKTDKAAAGDTAAPAPSPRSKSTISKALQSIENTPYEFGGPLGCLFIMLFSHGLLYYVYYCLNHNGGAMWYPTSLDALKSAFATTWEATVPSKFSVVFYLSFLLLEFMFAANLPGLDLKGRPDDRGHRLVYKCNGLYSWYATLALMVGVYLYNPTLYKTYYDNLGGTMTVAVIAGNAVALACYLYGFASKQTHRMTGNPVYDFFMGALLHPRIGNVDIKFWAEIRISWYLLFLNTVSCAVTASLEGDGKVPLGLYVLILSHLLYANATAKGEHYVPPTWDMFYEKFGWMLSFWNFAGVPFLYCLQSVYICKFVTPETQYPPAVYALLAAVLLGAYYIWDTAQSQKNHFRLAQDGFVVNRWTFPRLPWQVLENPSFIRTKAGTPLLTDGWWKYARKIHYTCDIIFALIWGLACGFDHFLPYFYVVFFTSMILHRYQRDMHRCALKYGADWEHYLERVPYAFIPGLI